MAAPKLTVLHEEPSMFIQRPSSGSSQDVTHILATTFRDLFTRDLVEKESVWNLDRSRTGDESYHEKYVEQLKKVQVERERHMAESAMLERHIMQARAKSMAEDERQLNRAASDCEMYHDLGLPPVESSYSHCLDSSLLRKHGLIVPEDFSTREPPPSRPPKAGDHPQFSEATESSTMQVLSRDRDHAQVRQDHALELEAARAKGRKKGTKKDVNKHGSLLPESRELHRKDMAIVYKKSDFLRNARHRPPNETGGKRTLVKANTVMHKLGGAKTAVVDTSPSIPAVIFVATPSPVIFSKYQVGNVYEATLDLKNVSAASRPLRVVPPKTQNFAVGLGKFPGEQGIVAPGMSCQYNIRFMPDSLMDFEDELRIQTQASDPLIVKLQGKRAPPVLSLPPVIDCGHCLINGTITKEFIVKNEGGSGRFCVMPRDSWPATSFKSVSSGDKTDLPPFVIHPAMFELQASHVISLYVTFSPKEESIFEETITVVCDNCTVKHFTIRGGGQTAGVLLKSVSGGESAPSLGELRDLTAQHHVRFKSVNPLTTGTKHLVLQNATDVELPYYWQCYTPIPVNPEPDERSDQNGGEESVRKEPSTSTRQLDGSMVFQVTPDRGILPPGGKCKTSLSFAPPMVGSYNSVLHLILENIPDTVTDPSPTAGRDTPPSRKSSQPHAARLVDVTALEVEVRGDCEEFNVMVEPYAVIIPGRILVSTTVRKQLVMTNYSQYPAVFRWDNVSDCHIIEVQPNHGQIPARSSIDLEVTLTASRVGPLDETIQCHIENQSQPVFLKVQAHVKGPTVIIDMPSIDFGLIQFGDSSTMEVMIRNESHVAAKYQIRESPEFSVGSSHTGPAELILSKSEGELAPLASEVLSVTFRPIMCRKVSSVLECIVQDGTDCFVPVRADVQRPQACLLSSTIILQKAYRGVPTQRRVTLINQTLLPALFEWGELIGPQATSCQVIFDPARGRMEPHQELEVSVTMTADLVGLLKDFLVPCRIAGMIHPVVLSVKGEVEGLRVTYSLPEQDPVSTSDSALGGEVEINFGSEVELGSSPGRSIQIKNHTAIEAPFNICVEHFMAGKPPTPPECSRKRVTSPKRRGLLARTTNLADPKSKSTSQLQAEYTKAILRDNRGVAFMVDPACGTLKPHETLEVRVTVFSDMWGTYRDNLICKVADLDPVVVPVRATVVGCPLKFQMSTLKGQIPVVRFGTHVCGVPRVQRPLKVINNSPCDLRVDWQTFSLLEGDPTIMDLIVSIGDPFPILDQTGREIEPPPFNPDVSQPTIAEFERNVNDTVRVANQSSFVCPGGDAEKPRSTGTNVSSHKDLELDQQVDAKLKERPKLVSVILQEHEGNLASGPFSVDRSQVLIPAKSQVGIVTYFTPDVKYLPSLEATDCVGYALGYLTLAEEADRHPSEWVERSQRFDVEPLRLDFTAHMKPAILKIETSEEEGMVFQTAASRLLQRTAESPHWTLHPSFAPSVEATLTNSTQTPLSFQLVVPEPFALANLDPVPKRPGEERQKRRSFKEFQKGEMVTLPSQTNVEISIDFKLTLDLIKSALADLQLTTEVGGEMLLTECEGERKLHIGRDLLIRYNNGTAQKLPLHAVVTLPSLEISPESLDFGTCLVGQERSLEVTVTNRTASASVFKAHLCSQDPVDEDNLNVFTVSPTVGYLEAHVTHVSHSKAILKMAFTARHNIPYEGTFMFQGILGEEVKKVKVIGQGSYDNRHEALVKI